ncbi:MAG: alpha/beta-hydrolase family protein [Actinomycetota bacterium]|nr:alpha/beta-hydrolase family protein [Actinomycetota bacterium]
MELKRTLVRAADVLNPLLSSPGGPLEGMAMATSFEPSLMPRTSMQQGIMMGLAGLTVRSVVAIVEQGTRRVTPASAGLSAKLAIRGAIGAVGAGAAMIPQQPGESLWRSGVRSGGQVLAAVAISGALYDAGGSAVAKSRNDAILRPILSSAAITAGMVALAGKNLKERKQVIKRWPVEQKNELPMALGIGWATYAAGSGLGKGYLASRSGLVRYLGPGPTKRVIGGLANAVIWAGGAVTLYNVGVGYIGRSNEKVEPAYAMPPLSPLVSGSKESTSPFEDLGLQGRRFVTDVTSSELIEEVLGEPAKATPIRVFIGYNSEPMYSMGRTEMAMAELERTGAFDRSNLLLVSPTGTGWVDQTMIESAEFLAKGDIATCLIQYGRFPSFLSVQKVALGRHQFRALLWSVRQRLAERPPEQRPKVFVFGESLGAWASSDVLMYQGIDGFDHYGIDSALWVGLPGLAKWSRNGMAAGASTLVPDGSVGVFDNPDEIEELSIEQQDDLRATILSHDNDPIAVLSTDLMVRKPGWLDGTPGRGVPEDMDYTPMTTFLQIAIDAMNAMVTVPGHFGSFGHDYRGDMARMVRAAYGFRDITDDQIESIEQQLVTLELERAERIKAAKAEEAPAAPQYRGTEFTNEQTGAIRMEAGVPLDAKRTSGARWFKKFHGTDAGPEEMQ